MTDLEVLFQPLVDESRAQREPIEVIETRARDRRHRRRRQRVQYRIGAAFATVTLVATAIGIVHARGTGDSRAVGPIVTTAPPTTDGIAPTTPAGWTTYDYGLARLSVPPGWRGGSGCPQAHVVLMVDPTNDLPGCGAGGGGPNITIRPIAPGFVFHPNDPPLRVNGIPYELESADCPAGITCPIIVWAPRLGVMLSFVEVGYQSILSTLTFSTYARVLQRQTGPASASWKTITFAGYSVRVPADWSTVDLRAAGMCEPRANTVYLGSQAIYLPCANLGALPTPIAWVHLEQLTIAQSATPTTNPPGRGEVRLRRHPTSGPFVRELAFTVGGGRTTVELTLGLGIDAAVARGILGSVKVIGP